MSGEQDRARQYRHRADEVRSLLHDVQNETTRAKLKDVADEYDALASALEAKGPSRAS